MKQLLLGLTLGLLLGTAGTLLADGLVWDNDGRAYFKQDNLNPHAPSMYWSQGGHSGQLREAPIGPAPGTLGSSPC